MSIGAVAPTDRFGQPELFVFPFHSGALSAKRLHRPDKRCFVQMEPPKRNSRAGTYPAGQDMLIELGFLFAS